MKAILVLLIDDSPTFLQIARRFLQECRQVRVVGSADGGRAGLALAIRLRPTVILLDLAMPDMHGLVAIPLLRQALPSVGIVVLTLLDGESYRPAALLAGADELVSKGSMGTDLLPAILRVARTRKQAQLVSTEASVGD